MMVEIVSSLAVSVALFLAHIAAPGRIALACVGSSNQRSIAHIALTGIALNLFTVLVAQVLFREIGDISVSARVMLVTTLVLLWWRYRDRSAFRTPTTFATSRPLLKAITFSALVFVSGLLVLSHNVGFDDYAHLDYLVQIRDGGHPFPLYLDIVAGKIEAARYPIFGALIAAIAYGIPKSIFFLYYLFGFALLLAVIALIFSEVDRRSGYQSAPYLAVGVFVAILIFAAPDNYLNFFVYPLQESKLLIIAGLTTLLVGIKRETLTSGVGISLLVGGVFFHLNTLLLSPLIVAFLMSFGLLGERTYRVFIRDAFLFSAITGSFILAALFLGNDGLLRTVETSVTSVASGPYPEPPSLFERLLGKIIDTWSWVTDGRDKSRYIERVFSVEVLSPLLVVLFSRLKLRLISAGVSVALAMLLLGVVVVKEVPRQIAALIMKSGPFITLVDASYIQWSHKQVDEFVTDPYTATIFDALGFVKMLDVSPIFVYQETRTGCGRSKASQDKKSNSLFLFNQRYWGEAGNDESYDAAENWIEDVKSWRDRNQLVYFETAMGKVIHKVKLQVWRPSKLVEYTGIEGDCLMAITRNAPGRSIIWRDLGLVVVEGLDKDRIYSFEYDGAADLFDLVYQYSSTRSGKDFTLLEFPDEEGVRVKKFRSLAHMPGRSLLGFIYKFGHFGGLGILNRVSLIDE